MAGTVSVPPDKITKARAHILAALASRTCTLSTINKLLGSLRYVTTCFPAARAFSKNIQVFAATFTHNHVRRTVPKCARRLELGSGCVVSSPNL